MKFGVNLLSQHKTKRSQHDLFWEMVEQARLAEDLGFDAVFLNEHHPFAQGEQLWLQPLPALAGLATATTRIGLGTNIVILPLYNTLRLAEDVAMIHSMSGGRVILGAAIGYKPEEFVAFGVPKAKRAPIFTEQVELLRRLWTEAPVSFDGAHHSLEEVSLPVSTLWPTPPPIWVGAEIEVSIARAARLGDAWLPADTAPISILKDDYAFYALKLAERGLQLSDVERPLMRETYVHRDRNAARSTIADYALNKYREYWRDFSPQLRAEWPNDQFGFDELAEDRFIVGDPDECIQQIERHLQELGTTFMIFRIQKTGISHQQTMEAIELLGRDVITQFRD